MDKSMPRRRPLPVSCQRTQVRQALRAYRHVGRLGVGRAGGAGTRKKRNVGWYVLDALPEPMFEMCKLSLDSYKTGRTLYEG